MQTRPTVSVIILTLNAENEIKALLQRIIEQSYPINDIVVVDSSSEDKTLDICREFRDIRIIQIEKKDFDHGRTRDMALRTCNSDIVVFLTQDAYPINCDLIENLIRPFSDIAVAVATARQIPKNNAWPMEKLIREFNYPGVSSIKSKEDINRLGIKAFFSSDVCAAYSREIYEMLGGFEYPLKTNEDMFYAAKAIAHGYKTAYVADAIVAHSHNFSLKAQYKRNYLQGYEIEKHRNLLGNVKQEKEGLKLVKYVSTQLLKRGRMISFIHFGLDCFARYIGSKHGKKAFNRSTR